MSRQVKDTLTITFIPVCIIRKYRTVGLGPPSSSPPRAVEGTPGWANYLSACPLANSVSDVNAKLDALQRARIGNITTRGVNVIGPVF